MLLVRKVILCKERDNFPPTLSDAEYNLLNRYIVNSFGGIRSNISMDLRTNLNRYAHYLNMSSIKYSEVEITSYYGKNIENVLKFAGMKK